jgi:hypothetical protein
MNYHISFIVVLLSFLSAQAQETRKALFIGNSYTASSNLPQLVSQIALSCGDTLIYDSNTPGGYTFEAHCSNITTLAKISTGSWDYVVLQEQSQRPSLQDSVVEQDVFPYAAYLDSLICAQNPCAETMFFMTWGRKNGDASFCPTWPPVCTYQGMDSLLSLRYMMMAEQNNAVVSPVGAVWKYIRQHYPSIELYSPDESHPSEAGSYAAACCFYTSVFRKNPENISYNFTLSQADADSIKKAAKTVVFDNMTQWFTGTYDPVAGFTHVPDNNTVTFTNNSVFSDTYYWDFGDGNNSAEINPVHSYATTGNFQVSLVASHCNQRDTLISTVNIVVMNIQSNPSDLKYRIFPNPASQFLSIENHSGLESHFSVCNMEGQNFLQISTKEQLLMIPVQNLNNGIYLLSILNENSRSFYKIVIHH